MTPFDPAGLPLVWTDETFGEPGDAAPATETPTAPALTPDEAEAEIAKLKTRPEYRLAAHPRHEAVLEKILSVRRAALGAKNEILGTIEGPDDSAPDADGYTRADLVRGLPGEW